MFIDFSDNVICYLLFHRCKQISTEIVMYNFLKKSAPEPLFKLLSTNASALPQAASEAVFQREGKTLCILRRNDMRIAASEEVQSLIALQFLPDTHFSQSTTPPEQSSTGPSGSGFPQISQADNAGSYPERHIMRNSKTAFISPMSCFPSLSIYRLFRPSRE